MNGHGDGDGAGTGTGLEVKEGAQDGDGGGDGAGTGTGVGTRRRTLDGNGDGNGDGSEHSSGAWNGDDSNGNEDRIGEGGRDAKKRKTPQIVIDAVRETGETWVKRDKNVEKKGLVQ